MLAESVYKGRSHVLRWVPVINPHEENYNGYY